MISAWIHTQVSYQEFEFSHLVVTVILLSKGKLQATWNSYLEALEGFLSTCNVLSSVRDNDNWDFVVMATEELLCSANNVSDHDGGAQREDKVLVIGVQDKSVIHLACKEWMSPVSYL